MSPEKFAELMHQFSETPLDDSARGGVNVELSGEATMYATSTLTAWHQDPDYVDELGEPVQLALEGPRPSLRDLYESTWRVHELSEPAPELFIETVSRLESHGSIEEVEPQVYRPLRSTFLINAKGAAINVLLGRLADFADMIHFNGCLGGGRFDRVAKVSEFPVEALPLLNAHLEQDGMRFLERIDAFMEDQKRSGQAGDTREIGVGIYFIHRDD